MTEVTDDTISWSPITPLSVSDRAARSSAMQSIYETWEQSRERLKEHSADNLAEFNRRLVRRLSIETGILERLYDLDRGTTEALVAHGFSEELVARSSTDIEPSRLIDILRDQEAAIELVMDCIAGQRPLTKGLIHELQSILTRHQPTTDAVDQFGNRQSIELKRGQFKNLPNNPKRPDGRVHEYCPPLHVEAEMDHLVDWLEEYSEDDPVMVAAWFHHRFTQIHPYQDGNGRTVRALTTLILLRRGLLPLVIDRDLRVEYLEGLECADRGDLSKLISTFERLERNAITQALSVDVDADIAHHKSLTVSVIESLADKFNRRREEKYADLRTVNSLAVSLRERAKASLDSNFSALSEPISKVVATEVHIHNGGTEIGNGHWYKYEIVQTAQAGGRFANFSEDHYFVKASMRVGQERLVFVISFHHVGRDLSGMMEATAFGRLESFHEDESGQVESQFFVCSLEPFVYTNRTSIETILDTFDTWLDRSTAVAFKEFGDRL